MAMGIIRKIDAFSGQEIAVIRYFDGVELEVSATAYRLNGYSPPFQQLPLGAGGHLAARPSAVVCDGVGQEPLRSEVKRRGP